MKTNIRAEQSSVYLTVGLLLAVLLAVFAVATYATQGVSDKSASRGGMCSTSTDCVCVDGPDGGRVCGGQHVPRRLNPLVPRDMARVP